MRISVFISPGEYLDKLTILEIKQARIVEPEKLANVRREFASLQSSAGFQEAACDRLARLKTRLREVNETLWDIEDEIRLLDAAGDFGERFVTLARAVYGTNDRRAALKREINELLGSDIPEEKSYAQRQSGKPT